MPVAFISTRTSPAFGPSRSSSTISSGFFASNAMAARVFILNSTFAFQGILVSDVLLSLSSAPSTLVRTSTEKHAAPHCEPPCLVPRQRSKNDAARTISSFLRCEPWVSAQRRSTYPIFPYIRTRFGDRKLAQEGSTLARKRNSTNFLAARPVIY